MTASFTARSGRLEPTQEVRLTASAEAMAVRRSFKRRRKADTTGNEVDDALARAVLYRTLSTGFQAPTEERVSQVGAREGFPVVGAALWRLERGPRQTNVERIVARLSSVSLPHVKTLAATFARLFGHTARGLVCACETEYGPDNAFHQPQQLADISGYYLAFGLQPTPGSEARVDHIACELEFMDFLNRKQAWLLANARRAHSDETLNVTERAERTFLRDHLARFGRAFATHVVAEDTDGYFGVLGDVLLALLDSDCTRLEVKAGPVDLVLRPEVVDDTPMACGSANELIQIQRKP